MRERRLGPKDAVFGWALERPLTIVRIFNGLIVYTRLLAISQKRQIQGARDFQNEAYDVYAAVMKNDGQQRRWPFGASPRRP